jgi:probable phosphoglycerate mutase
VKLKSNRYFILRHGKSRANVEGIVVSSLKEGIRDEWSLAPEGAKQVEQSVRRALDCNLINGATIIYSSPFSRCKRTAEIARAVLNTEEITLDERLRERFFGDWEGTDHSAYERVWKADQRDANHKRYGVESPAEVATRMLSLLMDLEERHKGEKILLVSHGDPLQILIAVLCESSPACHRLVQHLETAEIRELQ